MKNMLCIAKRTVQVMRYHDDGHALPAKGMQELIQRSGGFRIQPGGRLVQAEQLIRGAEGARQQNPLLLAAGKGTLALTAQVCDAKAFQGCMGPLFFRSGEKGPFTAAR